MIVKHDEIEIKLRQTNKKKKKEREKQERKKEEVIHRRTLRQ
jgi:hypothetical protein